MAAGGDPAFMKGRDDEYNVDESTIGFLKNVLTETMALFPGRFVHIGGDEVDLRPWRANPAVQSRIRNLGLKDERELQAWFVGRMENFAASHSRRAVGWDEILAPGLRHSTVIMSWRGVQHAAAAAKSGHDVAMAPTDYTYLDSYQWIAPHLEPVAKGGFLPHEKVYAFEPVPLDLGKAVEQRILGAQAQLWTESISDFRQLEYAAWPRLCAIAEVLWSPRKSRDFADFIARLKPDLEKLKVFDIRFRPLTPIPAPAARWKAGDAAAQVSRHEWDVTAAVPAGGRIDVVFVKTSGGGHAELEWVELLRNGKVVRRHTRPGSTEWRRRSNDYRFELPPYVKASRYVVSAGLRGAGGTQTSGDIYVVPAMDKGGAPPGSRLSGKQSILARQP